MRLPELQETGPRGTRAGVRPWPGPCCVGTLVSPGDGTRVFAGLPRQRSGALYKCVSPAVANTPALPLSVFSPWGSG